MAQESTISLKLYIDKKGERVLFAGVKKDFVDFLLHMLSLPLATANRLLREQGMLGSISNLCSSIESFDNRYIQQKQTKETILNPVLFHENNYNNYVPLFFPKNWISIYGKRNGGNNCGPMFLVCSRYYGNVVSSDKEVCGFVNGMVTYIVLDNLETKPVLDISIIKDLLDKCNVKNFALLQVKEVNFGMAEAMKLLKASLQSQTVLTDVFLKIADNTAS